jgi:2-dehydropantoate 2-reductase
MREPKIAVIGPGGVGSYFAAHLTAAGRDVLSCARRPFDRYLIESDTSPIESSARVITDVADAAAIGPIDWVFVAVKAHQTEGASDWISALCGADTTVVALQNGVEAVERLTPYVNGAAIIAAVVYCGSELLEPGHARHLGAARLILPDTAAGRRTTALFEGTAPKVIATDQYLDEVWFKLAVNVVFNGITAITDRPMEVLGQPQMTESVRQVINEVFAVGRAEGATTGSDRTEQFIAMLADLPPHGLTSMLQDRRAGRITETDAIHGAVGRMAAKHGLQAPLSSLIGALVTAGDPSEKP